MRHGLAVSVDLRRGLGLPQVNQTGNNNYSYNFDA